MNDPTNWDPDGQVFVGVDVGGDDHTAVAIRREGSTFIAVLPDNYVPTEIKVTESGNVIMSNGYRRLWINGRTGAVRPAFAVIRGRHG